LSDQSIDHGRTAAGSVREEGMMTELTLHDGSPAHPFIGPIDDVPSPRVFALIGSVASGRFSRNAIIYREGDLVGQLYKVMSGVVRTCRLMADGRRQIGAFYFPGEIFGLEIEARHVLSAEAVVESQILAVTHLALPFDRSDHEETAETWELMRHELRRSRDHVLLLALTAYERVVHFLLEIAKRSPCHDHVELAMSRQDIADYLGLTIETISRMLTQLESEKAIAIPEPKQIVLRKRATLRGLTA
jgi:CRP/FNR family transcriptional regulator, nitrogen fixation regulation protein